MHTSHTVHAHTDILNAFLNAHYELLHTLATRLPLHCAAVYGKQSEVERESHGLEEFNSSKVLIS